MRFIGKFKGVDHRIRKGLVARPLERVYASFLRDDLCTLYGFRYVNPKGRVSARGNDVLAISTALYTV